MRRGPRPEAGFTLAEVLVAMSVFAVLVTIVVGLVVRTAAVASSNDRRVVAAALADRQIESARAQSAVALVDGLTTRTETVGGVTYTVRQTATYVPSESATSVCSGTGATLAYKLVTVTVTWSGMGRVKPVRADTLRAVGLGTEGLDQTRGSVAVSVVGAAGADQPDVVVTLGPTGATATTGDDGCAVFTGLAPGTYTATAGAAGWVGTANTRAATVTSLGVTAGGLARGTLLYDTERAVSLTLEGPAGSSGHVVPTGLRTVVRNSYLAAAPLPVCGAPGTGCATGLPGESRALFPDVYDVWAGTCADAATAAGVPAVVDLTAASAAAVLPAGAALVDVRDATGTSLTGRTVTAVHAADPPGAGPRCVAGESYPLPPTAAGGTGVLLPPGTWTFSTPGAAAVTRTLTTAATEPVVLTVTP